LERLARFPVENPNPIIRINVDGILLYANKASEAVMCLWGTPVGGPVPDNWRAIVSESLSAGGRREADVKCDGRIFSFVVVPIVDSGYVNLYGTDVTEERLVAMALDEARQSLERRVAERTSALQATNEILERVFSVIHVCIVYLDKDFNFIRVNRAYADACGHPEEFFVGKNHFALYPHAENEQIFRDVVRTGKPFVVFEKPFVFLDFPECGTTYWDWSLQPVLGPSGEVTGLIFVLRDTTEQRRSRDRLIVYQRRLRRMASELILAEEESRRRIAKDLHDQIGQTLVSCLIRLGDLKANCSDAVAGSIEECRRSLSEVVSATRALTFELASPVLYEIGLEAAIERLLEQHQRDSGFSVSFKVDGDIARLPDDVRVTLYGAVRELLANVAKHARAKNVSVHVIHEPGQVRIVAADDGVGFDPWTISTHGSDSSGVGLFSARERLEYMGGSLEVKSAPAMGTTVALKLATGGDASPEKGG
jgi:PAS domain S-box-containing protein